MKISEDKNLAFSYNIKKISPRLKNAINRDRKYVSRDAYREDIKRIINNCKEKDVLDTFEEQLRKTYSGNSYSEIINVSQKIKEDINKYKEDINKYKEDIIGDRLFIEESYIAEKDLLSMKELDESRRKVLEEAIYIFKKVDLIKNDYISIDNIKVSRIPIGSFMHEKGIVIPLNSLIDLETCAVKIINVLSSLGDNSTEYKDKIVGNLIKIIYQRNRSTKIDSIKKLI